MARKLVVCCDGTWNTPRTETNIFRTYRFLRERLGTPAEVSRGDGVRTCGGRATDGHVGHGEPRQGTGAHPVEQPPRAQRRLERVLAHGGEVDRLWDLGAAPVAAVHERPVEGEDHADRAGRLGALHARHHRVAVVLGGFAEQASQIDIEKPGVMLATSPPGFLRAVRYINKL